MVWASGFASPLKEDVMWIFMALKSPSPGLGLNLLNLGSNGKHTNHYAAKVTATVHTVSCFAYVFDA
jgi:hypothetical protein